MFLNMVDTLVGAGVYRTLSLGRAHPLPEIALLYTDYVRSATQFGALKRAKLMPLPQQSTSVLGQKPKSSRRAKFFRFAPNIRHCSAAPLKRWHRHAANTPVPFADHSTAGRS
jgi:hypothetical protein